ERDVTAPRREAEATLARLEPYAWAAPGHADEIRALERDLERAAARVAAAEAKRGTLDAELRARGLEPARLRELHERFGRLAGDDRMLLSQYPSQSQAIAKDGEM